ncbi:MAG: DUF1508 domain-containing protein [Spirosomaceae bacterium]|nr:DUF1508 domain-containing protein [Spirosomataceae bacterium]
MAHIDEYDFSQESTSGKPGFETFKSEKDGMYYFHYNDSAGKALLFSESYPNEAVRDNGVESVKKNAPLDERWKVIEEGGRWYYALRAGNHQEIARGPKFESQALLLAALDYLKGKNNSFSIAGFLKASEAPESEREIDDYMVCSAYKGHTESPAEGFTTFYNENNKEYYFAVVDKDGEVLMRSEGYPTVAARDNGLRSVQTNRGIKERWKFIEEGGLHYAILKAGNHQEIARSCPYKDSESLLAAFSFLSEREIDDYMVCSAYKGHTESPADGFTTFYNENNKEYYFAMVDKDGDVLMRSEGYPTVAARDNGLRSVQTNRDIKERWQVIEEGGLHYVILKAGNHQEIARSCPYKDSAALFAIFPFLAAGASAGFPWGTAAVGAAGLGLVGAAVAADLPVVEIPEVETPSTDLGAVAAIGAAGLAGAASLAGDVDAPKVVPPVTPTYEYEEEAKGGIPPWLWWLLGAALVGALLWWLLKGCDKPEVKADVPAAATDSVTINVDTTKATSATSGPLIENFSTVVLYFDNDRPETKSLNYGQTYDAYLANKDKFEAEGDKAAVDEFFTKNVTKGYNDFKDLTDKLAAKLKDGYKAEITVRAFTSPLASDEYNKALSERRISSIMNQLSSYNNGELKEFIDKGMVTITQEPNGEDSAPAGVSDDARNRKSSVFDIAASKERRVEITSLRAIKNQ